MASTGEAATEDRRDSGASANGASADDSSVNGASEHYLQAELDALVQSDPAIWSFLQAGSLDGVWYWDLDDPEHEWMSPDFWRLFGIDPATKDHRPSEWLDMIFPEDAETALENFQRHLADPGHPYDQLVRYRHADGSTVWVRCRGIAIRDAEGKPKRMLGAHNDVTELMRARQDAEANERAAQTASDELRAFAYALSHDMKAPANTLALLMNELSEQLEGTDLAEARALVAMANQTATRLCCHVDEVLDYTRVIGDAPDIVEIDFGRLIDGVLHDLSADIAACGARISIGQMPPLRAARMQIGLLLQNLIGNAIKYRRQGVVPLVAIEGAEGADTVSISITDNGIGIAPQHHERIFEMFRRLHRRDEIDGTGLGLALCRRVAVGHGGEISLASEPGRGSTFTVTLPRAPA